MRVPSCAISLLMMWKWSIAVAFHVMVNELQRISHLQNNSRIGLFDKTSASASRVFSILWGAGICKQLARYLILLCVVQTWELGWMLFAGKKNYLFHCRDKEIWLRGEENIRGRDKNHGLNGSVEGQHVVLRGCLHDKSQVGHGPTSPGYQDGTIHICRAKLPPSQSPPKYPMHIHIQTIGLNEW